MSCCARLFGLGKTDGALAEVVDRVPWAEEGVAENGKRADGRREVHAHEGGDTAALDLEDVVVGADGEFVAGKRKCDVGEAVTGGAVDAVLAVVALLGANLLVQELSEIGGEGDERSASVKNDTSVLEVGGLIAEADGVKVDLPVSLAAQRDLGDLASVVVLVDTAKDDLGVILAAAEVKGKDGLVNELLVDHGVEGRNDTLDSDAVKAETENAVKATEGESQARLAGGLAKVEVLDVDIADGEGILGDKTLHLTGTVADLKLGAVGLVGG